MNVSFWTPLFKGQLHSGGTNFGPLLKGHLYSGERGHFFLVPKLGFNLHSGVTWALKKWLTTKISLWDSSTALQTERRRYKIVQNKDSYLQSLIKSWLTSFLGI